MQSTAAIAFSAAPKVIIRSSNGFRTGCAKSIYTTTKYMKGEKTWQNAHATKADRVRSKICVRLTSFSDASKNDRRTSSVHFHHNSSFPLCIKQKHLPTPSILLWKGVDSPPPRLRMQQEGPVASLEAQRGSARRHWDRNGERNGAHTTTHSDIYQADEGR